jgi:hypothetical protein
MLREILREIDIGKVRFNERKISLVLAFVMQMQEALHSCIPDQRIQCLLLINIDCLQLQ